jgi:hypothetical protein
MQIKKITKAVNKRWQTIQTTLKTWRVSHVYKWVIAGLLVLCMLGVVDKVFDVTLKNKMDTINHTYLADETKEVRDIFLVLSEMKAGLAILKSAQAGFTFILELETQFGNIIEPLHRMVDNAWRVSFASLISLEMIRFAVVLTDEFGNFFLTLFLFVYLVGLFLNLKKKNRFVSVLVSVQRVLGMVVVFCYLLLPGYLLLSGALLGEFVDPHKANILENIKTHHAKFVESSNDAYKKQASTISTHIHKKAPEIKEHMHAMSRHLPVHIALHAVLYLVLPLLFMAFLYMWIRFAMHHYYKESRA